jgi:uncharacterized protein
MSPCPRTSILANAIRHHNGESVKQLIDANADVNEIDEWNETPLWHATYHGHLDIVECLLNAGADPNKFQDVARMPLWGALGKPDIFKVLVRGGADPKLFPGIIEKAAYANQLDTIRILVEDAKVDIDECEPSGWWALATAVRVDHFDIFEYLLAHGANPNHRSAKGDWNPALWHALRRPNFIRPLLKAGANPTIIPGILESATTGGGCLESVQILVEDGHVPVDEQEPGGWWALATAIRDGLRDIFDYLLSKGANPNFAGAEGDKEVPLLRACYRGVRRPTISGPSRLTAPTLGYARPFSRSRRGEITGTQLTCC